MPDTFSQYTSIQIINDSVHQASQWVQPLRTEISRVIVGQKQLIERLLVSLLANGHLLLEGVPGLAKTLALKTLASAIDASFKRIQFTPDMLPADVVGTEVYKPNEASFMVKQGPVFANLILADEINRAPAKVQSALLEAMQERQVTIGKETFSLPDPFLVMATQNPIEQEGTYPLPEAQVDRFLLKVLIHFPSIAEERVIIDVAGSLDAKPLVRPVVQKEQILTARQVVNTIYMDDKIKDYIVSLVYATRNPDDFKLDLKPYIKLGASPRATLGIVAASKALAFLNGRGYVTPHDVKSIALDVMRHRVAISYEAEAEGISSDDVVQKVLDTIPVP
ncbi:MAG: MoxR family ATPase [SAR324 cluster bacterium]|uniref:MoxR family ATPase n=1 Tax=SAR324 cluster bacterium TaxID=2024889 RepID=A0A7X9FRG2_9DELT|nr:MoxR family ATPase [SAR324 cluster bacterium]